MESTNTQGEELAIHKARVKSSKIESALFLKDMFHFLKKSKKFSIHISSDKLLETLVIQDVEIPEEDISDKYTEMEFTIKNKASSDLIKIKVSKNQFAGMHVSFSRPLPKAKTICYWSDYKKFDDVDCTVFEIDGNPSMIRIVVPR